VPRSDVSEILDLYGIARRRKWSIVAGLFVGLFVALAYQMLATPKYDAQLQVMLMQKDASMPARGAGQQGGSDTDVAVEVLATHMEVFSSRRIVKEAIDRFELDRIPSIAEQIALREDPVEFIQQQLAVTFGGDGEGKSATVLVASYRDPSPEHCATILNSILSCYQDFLGKTFQNTSDEAVNLITEARQELEAELLDIEMRYRRFRETSPSLIWDAQAGRMTNIHQTRLLLIEQDLADQRRKESTTRSRLETIREFLAKTPADQITDKEKLALLSEEGSLRMKLAYDVTRGDASSEAFQADMPTRTAAASVKTQELLGLRLKEQELLKSFAADYPGVQLIRKQIETIEQFLAENRALEPAADVERMTPADMLENGMRAMEHDLDDLKKLRRDLEQEYKTEAVAAGKLAGLELQGEALADELSRKRGLYEEVVERLGEINLIRDYGGFVAEVIAPAEAQTKAAWPKLPLTVAGGALLGMLMGIALAIFRDFSDTTFRGPEQLEEAIGVSIVAHIPMIQLRKRQLKSASVDETLATYHVPSSREAEAFRSLRTALLFDSRKHGSKLIGFSSPTPGDGKTTSTVNLAVSIAQSGKSVLVIDCDLRRPRASGMLGVGNESGLTDLLLDGRELQDVIVDVDGIENLSVIPSGGHPPNPAELLMLPEFEQLLAVVREKFDYVLLDLPPLLAVSDPAIVAPMLDGIVFTLRVVKNGQKAAMKARKILDDLEVRIIGAVVNASSMSVRSYGYADADKYEQQYGYTYGYGRMNQKYFGKSETPVKTRA